MRDDYEAKGGLGPTLDALRAEARQSVSPQPSGQAETPTDETDIFPDFEPTSPAEIESMIQQHMKAERARSTAVRKRMEVYIEGHLKKTEEDLERAKSERAVSIQVKQKDHAEWKAGKELEISALRAEIASAESRMVAECEEVNKTKGEDIEGYRQTIAKCKAFLMAGRERTADLFEGEQTAEPSQASNVQPLKPNGNEPTGGSTE